MTSARVLRWILVNRDSVIADKNPVILRTNSRHSTGRWIIDTPMPRAGVRVSRLLFSD